MGEFAFGRTETLMGIRFTGPEKYYYLLLALTLIIVVVCLRLQNSRIGRAWEAIREDEIAKAMGINTRNIKLLAFAMGASFRRRGRRAVRLDAGASSVPSFSLMESISILCMVVLGGMGHIPGVILGAIILAGLPEFLRAVVEPAQHMLAPWCWIRKASACCCSAWPWSA